MDPARCIEPAAGADGLQLVPVRLEHTPHDFQWAGLIDQLCTLSVDECVQLVLASGHSRVPLCCTIVLCRYPSVVRPAAVGEEVTNKLTYKGRTKRLFLFALFSPLAPLLYIWTVAYVSDLGPRSV